MRTKLIAVVLTILTISAIGFTTIPESMTTQQPETVQFVFAGSNYPDQYGQGIEVFWSYENSTGAWEPILDPAFLIFPADNDKTNIELNYTVNTALKIGISANINHSLHNLGSYAEALNIMRLNLTMTHVGLTVFSIANMTWNGGSIFDDTPTTWAVSYNNTLNVIIGTGQIYEIIVTYEVFY